MPGGTGLPGLTSEANSPRRSPPRTLTAPISVIAAAPGDHPVVSRSTTANSTSARPVSGGSPAAGSHAVTAGLVTHTTVGAPADILAQPAPTRPAGGGEIITPSCRLRRRIPAP